MRVFDSERCSPQDAEWDVDLVDESQSISSKISDNKWVKLALIPVHFVLLLFLGFLATIACSFLISPIFVFWKCWSVFHKECQDIYSDFFGGKLE